MMPEQSDKESAAYNGNGLPSDCPEFIRILIWSLQKFGIATILLLIGGWYVATRIADPLLEKYIQNIDIQGKVAQQQAETLMGLQKMLQERATMFAQMTAEHKEMIENLRQARADHRQILENNTRMMERLSKLPGG